MHPKNRKEDTDQMEKLYSINEFIEAFKISRETYYTWVSKGIVNPSKIGGVVRITETEVKRILENKTGG